MGFAEVMLQPGPLLGQQLRVGVALRAGEKGLIGGVEPRVPLCRFRPCRSRASWSTPLGLVHACIKLGALLRADR